MKYIAKKLQVYLNENHKKEYKNLLKTRREYIKINILQPVAMYNAWSKKSWKAVPSRRNYYWIVNAKDKEQYQIHRVRISKIDHKIKIIEEHAYENKEQKICKDGSLLTFQRHWAKNKKYIVQEKESRDYYILVDISNMQSFSISWRDIVRYYELDEVSK
jgi:hypothetical protein